MKRLLLCLLIFLLPFMTNCTDTTSHSHAVVLLIDTSGTYTDEIRKAQSIANYLLATLQPGDSLAVARIDTGSFSEKDIIQKITFDGRPSVSTQQKLAFKDKLDIFVKTVNPSSYTDITGGVIQAVDYLSETGAGKRTIFVFSDMQEELAKGYVRDFPLEMNGCEVVALNVTKLRKDILDPRKYKDRLNQWEKRIVTGGGKFRVINDLEKLDNLLGG